MQAFRSIRARNEVNLTDFVLENDPSTYYLPFFFPFGSVSKPFEKKSSTVGIEKGDDELFEAYLAWCSQIKDKKIFGEPELLEKYANEIYYDLISETKMKESLHGNSDDQLQCNSL